ncbi:PAS domain-containing sensor histidine kinase [Cesiribacter sp. SM1]|uniref:PAS domain-containing sensor histidine kinase n=1 Tax=Cesiribacter sp. SM1 TaxID=2861196 RepID=UPI001CD812F3|nr:PAS domain-containing sensor histidine kinase [Cesiribacter sp. SM1]
MHKDNALGALSFLEEVAERTSQVVFGYDIASNRFIYLNPSFEVVWNKTRESVYANPAVLLEAVHPEDKAFIRDTYQKLLMGTVKKEVEFRIVVAGKFVRWLYLSPLLLQQEGGQQLIAGFVEDRTIQRENQAYVQKFAARKNSLLEILSHDLSGPLSNIQGLSSLLIKELQEYNNPRLDKLVEMVASTSERSIGMIREFVKQEFMESVNVELIRERTDLVGMIKQVLSQYQASGEDLGKTFNYVTSDDEIYAEVDEYKLNQVVNNLISNAIKFTPDGGTITISIADKQENVLITVADNGIGIPAKYHQNLFEKFTKAKRTGLKGEPSLGLGMSLIKTIVEWHRGRIWFDSVERKGSTFYIELPKE